MANVSLEYLIACWKADERNLSHQAEQRLIGLAVAEVDRLQAIVDRLPTTADDEPVVPGMTLWYHTPAGIVPTPELLDWDEVAACVVDDLFQFYSTREAAKAAGEE